MVNAEIAAVFTEIADLLELKAENPFKVRAYRRAAAILQELAADVSTMDGGTLRGIDGIGTALAAKITEYVQSGRVEALERLRLEVPGSLAEVMAVPGIGPKLAARLHAELGIRDLADLRRALAEHRLREVRGLGPKSEANIAAGLMELDSYQGRRPLYEVLPLARELAQGLGALPEVEAVEVAGSVRRWRDTVGDLDLVVATTCPAAVGHYLTHLTMVSRVLARGDSRVSMVLHGGLQVDVRIAAPRAFASALHHFTGSKEHHVQLRALALKQGLSISEHGLQSTRTEEQLVPGNEHELYNLLGLPFIVPELREGRGEIDAALSDSLPELLAIDDIRGDLHVHSNWSDGVATLEEIARAAAKRGLEYVAICDHSQSLAIAGGLSAADLEERDLELARVNQLQLGPVLLSGVEVEIQSDGSLDLPDDVLARRDVVVASLHSGLRQRREQLMQRLRAAMSHPYVHIIGHPTGRLVGRRAGSDVDVEELVRLARATGTALEINSSPDRLDLADHNAYEARAAGVMLAINTDAHDLGEFDFLPFGVATARRGWLTPNSVLNCRPWPVLRDLLLRKHRRLRS